MVRRFSHRWQARSDLRLSALRSRADAVGTERAPLPASPTRLHHGFAVHRHGWRRDTRSGLDTHRQISGYDPTPEMFEKARQEFARAGMLGIPHVGTPISTPDAIKANPKLRVLVAQGAYDPLGGCSINTERAKHLAAEFSAAVQWKCYLGAHQMYLDAPARAAFSNDVKAFIRAAAAGGVAR